MWRDYVRGQKTAVDRYSYASVWVENNIYNDILHTTHQNKRVLLFYCYD